MFASKAVAYLNTPPFRYSALDDAPSFASKYYTWVRSLPLVHHSSVFSLSVSDEKRFATLQPSGALVPRVQPLLLDCIC